MPGFLSENEQEWASQRWKKQREDSVILPSFLCQDTCMVQIIYLQAVNLQFSPSSGGLDLLLCPGLIDTYF